MIAAGYGCGMHGRTAWLASVWIPIGAGVLVTTVALVVNAGVTTAVLTGVVLANLAGLIQRHYTGRSVVTLGPETPRRHDV